MKQLPPASLLILGLVLQVACGFVVQQRPSLSQTILLRGLQPDDDASEKTRRLLLTATISALVSSHPFQKSWAATGQDTNGVQQDYAFQPPPNFEATQKPVKTHLQEVNYVSPDIKGYQYGITVDPVRINSLREFGTPEEVAARVVTAEVNRDGVFHVTLVKDPVEDAGSYVLNYLSKGKRGDKHYVCKVIIQNNKLFVLTAQIREENYADKQKELDKVVDTFRVM